MLAVLGQAVATRLPVSNDSMAAWASSSALWPARACTDGSSPRLNAAGHSSTCLSKVRWNNRHPY